MSLKIIGEGLTFDDVLLVPRRSDILPEDVDPRTILCGDIVLPVPIISAAMDTVTGTEMAIAMAQAGGIGIIHRNQSPAAQAQSIGRVKRFEAGIIRDPITLPPTETMRRVREVMAKEGIAGIPIVEGRRLVGIITARDMRAVMEDTALIRDRMSRPVVTAREGTSLADAKRIMSERRIEKLPIVDEEGNLVGLMTMKDILKQETNRRSAKDREGRLRVGAAVGVFDYERAEMAVQARADVLVVDTAHGHSKNVLETVRELKRRFSVPVLAGNVATAEGAEELADAGADGIKVGIGPGSICTTRIVTGIGVPQLTAIYECARIAAKKGVRIVADGGVRSSGDITKALAMGADSVMLGNLLAGCEETPAEKFVYQGRTYKSYRGMGSLGALADGADRYAGVQGKGKGVPEGVEGMVPYRGMVAEVLHRLEGGLRAGMGYLGCRTLSEMRENARFLRITSAGLRESHPHNVFITREPPNYSLPEEASMRRGEF